MSRSKFDRLIDQFYEREGNTRAQQVLLRQIVRMRDPQAIPELLAIYKRKDAPAGLRRIAGQGLRAFWQLNQRVSQSARERRLAMLEPWLRRLRPVLTTILTVTLIVNIAILIARTIPPPPPPQQTIASPVDSLKQLYKQQIADGRASGTYMRLRWQEVQSHINVNCAKLPAPIVPLTPAAIDLKTYPGIQPLATDLNAALTQLAVLHTDLAAICADPTNSTAIAQASGDKGAAGQIVAVDAALTGLDSAQSDYDRWVAALIPNRTPSSVPTLTAGTPHTN